MHGQKAQQQKVNERNQQLFAQRHRLLMRRPTDEIGATRAQKRRHPGESAWGQAHIGIHEHEHRVPGLLRQAGAGMLLAAPTLRQRRSRHEPHAVVHSGQATHDRSGVVLGMVVHHNNFERHVTAVQRGFYSGANRCGFIARRY